eukprot:TRINITY_DN20896_c1_g1_i1.p1 TRINITY_DN20896_c1_g1~~TRINITY_DN20896_c1_g1_i1.p1  ORF type:complete len:308 (-),score=35.00 TRINITY_DN20896_c1_g1_i1:38-910(-)
MVHPDVQPFFQGVTLAEDAPLFDREIGRLGIWHSIVPRPPIKAVDHWASPTSKCLAKGSQAWLIQRQSLSQPVNGDLAGPEAPDGPFWWFLATDDEGQDVGWIKGSKVLDKSSTECRNHIHLVRSRRVEDMPSKVRSIAIQRYLDQDGHSNWEALLSSKHLREIRDMSFSEIRKLFIEHAMQPRVFSERHMYLTEVEVMAASGIGSKAIQLQCARSEEGVSVALLTLSGDELARLTLSTSEETVGALREVVSATLPDESKHARIVLPDGRMLADIDDIETIQIVFDIPPL